MISAIRSDTLCFDFSKILYLLAHFKQEQQCLWNYRIVMELVLKTFCVKKLKPTNAECSPSFLVQRGITTGVVKL